MFGASGCCRTALIVSFFVRVEPCLLFILLGTRIRSGAIFFTRNLVSLRILSVSSLCSLVNLVVDSRIVACVVVIVLMLVMLFVVAIVVLVVSVSFFFENDPKVNVMGGGAVIFVLDSKGAGGSVVETMAIMTMVLVFCVALVRW